MVRGVDGGERKEAVTRELPTLPKLLACLREFGVHATEPKEIAAAIKERCLDVAVCAGAVVEGRFKALTFEAYFTAIFGTGLDGKVVRKRRAKA